VIVDRAVSMAIAEENEHEPDAVAWLPSEE
jgi:hypothetical protein